MIPYAKSSDEDQSYKCLCRFSGLCTPIVEEDAVYVSMHIHFPATAFTDKRDTLYTLMALMARN